MLVCTDYLCVLSSVLWWIAHRSRATVTELLYNTIMVRSEHNTTCLTLSVSLPSCLVLCCEDAAPTCPTWTCPRTPSLTGGRSPSAWHATQTIFGFFLWLTQTAVEEFLTGGKVQSRHHLFSALDWCLASLTELARTLNWLLICSGLLHANNIRVCVIMQDVFPSSLMFKCLCLLTSYVVI